MATFTQNCVEDNSTLANFKQWAQFISNGFGASCCNWTQTADTGQVNWSTIGAVPSSTYVYEVWKQSDALTSSLQIFVKVEYGFSTTSARVRFTVGTGSNGSGTITGALATAQFLAGVNLWSMANQGATQYPCYISGDGAEIRILMWNTLTVGTYNMYFAIERSKDAAGANTGDYATGLCGSNNNISQQSILATGLVSPAETRFITTGTTQTTGASFNGTVAAFPVFPMIGKLGNPMLGTMAVNASDVADNSQVTVASMYGTTHNYVATKVATGFSSMTCSGGLGGALLMRYE